MTTVQEAISPRHHRLLLAVVALYVVILVLAGPHLHPVGVRGALDHYAERAEAMLDGLWKADPYHPFLYPELVAGLTAIVGDGFAAARVVSSLAAGLFVYSSTRLVHACHGRGPAVWTAVWLVANGSVLVGGVEAGSDMTATALAVTGLWCLLQPPTGTRVFTASLCFGLAVATRYNVASLAPAIVVVIVGSDRSAPWRLRLRRLALGTVAAVIGYVPSLLPNLLLFGTALPTQSWRNLAYKLSPTADPNALAGAYSSFGELYAAQGADLWNRSLADFAAIWTHYLGATLVGEQALAPIAALATVLLVGCLIARLLRSPGQAWPAMLLATSWTVVLAITFFPQVRLLLPLLPLLAGTAAAMCLGLFARRWLGQGLCGLVALAIAASAPATLLKFFAEHPLAEIDAARAIAAREGPLVRIASCYALMQRHVPSKIVYVSAPGAGAMTAANVFACVRTAIEQEPAEFLVAGRVTTPLPSLDDLRRDAPADFVVESQNDEVLVGRFLASGPDWLERAEATPTDDGRLRLRLRTKTDVPMVGFLVRSGDGTLALMPLANVSARALELVVPHPAGDPNQLQLTPCAILPSGVTLRAAPIRIAAATTTGK